LADSNLTPMMRQYHSIKSRYEDMILFFRMGDFYEMFESDAEEASLILNLALTKRHSVPMCGLPYHAADNYIERLLKAGKKIAICEQVEDPSQAKGIVKRDVVRVITPGTLTEDNYIGSGDNNYLMSFSSVDGASAICLCDISTSEFFLVVNDSDEDDESFFRDEFLRYSPGEIVVSETQEKFLENENGVLFSIVPEWVVDGSISLEDIKKQFNLITIEGILPENNSASLAAINSILYYLKDTQNNVLENITTVNVIERGNFVSLPGATQSNLELVVNMTGGKDNTLFSVINKTKTPLGLRLLKQNILKPLKNVLEINERLSLVGILTDQREFLTLLREELGGVRDIERLMSRIVLKRANPRDLIALMLSLQNVDQIKLTLLEQDSFFPYSSKIADFTTLINNIKSSIDLDSPIKLSRGGVIKSGYSSDLDELREISVNSHKWIANLQAREREKTGISNLRIKYNKVIGYFIEISKSNINSVGENYERKQTLVNNERFIIPELKEYESKILSANDKIFKLEEELFQKVRDEISKFDSAVISCAKVIAFVDMLTSFAVLANEDDYVCPVVVEDAGLEIIDGRHPVVEKSIVDTFVPNNTNLDLDENRIMIVTGPNMAGKSTYLRQTALIVLLAQIGSFVPASEAKVGVVDKIFTRIGASDNLARGQSTFLVEMIEAASILNRATNRSLIIMDELGRGTSTYDGLAIAWSVIEFLKNRIDKGGMTLFATHYHELTALGNQHGIGNLNVMVKEWNNEVIFLKKVVPGSADKSYGIHVARLAGLPDEVITRGYEILQDLEERSLEMGHDICRTSGTEVSEDMQLSLFKPYEQEIVQRIRDLDLNIISPLEAINYLAEMKDKIKD